MEYKKQLEYYLSNPGRFSILLIGERGIGKTSLINELSEGKEKVISANCASFSDDTMAESELFGHKKGSFTGAQIDKKGLFEVANGGILFLDEVHFLSKRVQEKLMTALQTESSGKNKGKFSFRQLGGATPIYVSVRPVFASNLEIKELKKKLLPDLFDRIAQLVLEIPSIKESKLNLKIEFSSVWCGMQFETENSIPALKAFYTWLNKINLDGNYRTLQSIAITWHQGRLMKLENEEIVFDFVKTQIEKFHSSGSPINKNVKYNFKMGAKKKEMEKEYRKALYVWAKENYLNLTDAQIAKELSISRLDMLLK
jgi:transcriptional regulator with AAA-type ATPase domain